MNRMILPGFEWDNYLLNSFVSRFLFNRDVSGREAPVWDSVLERSLIFLLLRHVKQVSVFHSECHMRQMQLIGEHISNYYYEWYLDRVLSAPFSAANHEHENSKDRRASYHAAQSMRLTRLTTNFT